MTQLSLPRLSSLCTFRFISLLPLLAALLFEAHTIVLTLKISSISAYSLLVGQLLLEALPMFMAQLACTNRKRTAGVLIWAACFIGYPLLMIFIDQQVFAESFRFKLFPNGWLLMVAASLVWWARDFRLLTALPIKQTITARLSSLTGVVWVLLAMWVLGMSAMFATHEDPMLNQPIPLVLDPVLALSKPFTFLNYVWQFALAAVLLFSVYWVNANVLIKHFFTRYGVLAFLCSATVAIAVLTPTLSFLLLLLPLNDLPPEVHNLLPGGNSNVFHPVNYQFLFTVFALTTPVILASEVRKKQSHLLLAEKQRVAAELKLLQQQVNPHFLFNTLNSIYALCLEKSDAAPDVVMQLSDLLRYAVYDGQEQQVSLDKELQYLKNYLALQSVRHGNRCRIEATWPDKRTELKITPLLLIVLLENAFKYGVEPSLEEATLILEVRVEGNELHFRLENPMPSVAPTSTGGLGLENLKRRLSLLYPNKYSLRSEADGGVWKAQLRLELDK